MKIALVFAAVAVTLGAACDTSDVLDAYAAARDEGGDCSALVQTFSPYLFNGERPTTSVMNPLCSDECSLRFLWKLHVAGCAAFSDVRPAFSKAIETCGCTLDEFFVAAGGNCVSTCSENICTENERGIHYDDPYFTVGSGSEFTLHVKGARMTFAADSHNTGNNDGIENGRAVGGCEGNFVRWDYANEVCVPSSEYLGGGSRVLPFADFASQDSLNTLKDSLRNMLWEFRDRVNDDTNSLLNQAAAAVADNQKLVSQLTDAVNDMSNNVAHQLLLATNDLNDRIEELEGDLEGSFGAVREEIQENVIGEVEAMSSMGDSVASLMDTFEHTAFLDHSKPVYRWGRWSSYNQWQGWYGHGHHGDHTMFGGIEPQTWGDNNGRAWQLSGSKDMLRGLFNKRGYMGWQGTVWHEEWMSHSSTTSHHTGVLFRIKNTRSNSINWRANMYYTSHAGWSERASATINGASTWESGGNYCGAHCSAEINFNIPGGRISTVIMISASSPRSSGCCDFGPRGNWLAFRENSLQLPNGLEYVDDMDYVTGGWES